MGGRFKIFNFVLELLIICEMFTFHYVDGLFRLKMLNLYWFTILDRHLVSPPL